MGLNEAYKSTRRHILMLQPIPDTEDVFNMVAQEESHKNIKPSMRVDMAFQNSGPSYLSYNIPQDNAAYAVAFQSNHFSPKPICTHCGRTGHTVQKCYKLHGYPPDHKLHQRSSNSSTRGQAQNT